MKKVLFILVLTFVLVLVGCTTTFDISNLQPNSYSLEKKLPNLEVLSDETTTTLGSTESVSTSSYVYTVFKRELVSNVLDTTTEKKGSIEMVITYHDLSIGILGKGKITMEIEINIYDKNEKLVWNRTYHGVEGGIMINNSLYHTDTGAIDTLTVRLEHKLIDMFKDDVAREYDTIVKYLN